MKLAVFGATGKVGRHVIEQALSANHDVTALVRNPDQGARPEANLRYVVGDARDLDAVEQTIRDADVVICALGAPLMNNEKIRSKGTLNIIAAMQNAGVRRLICLSGFGAGESWAQLPLHYKYLIFPFILRRVFVDHELQEAHVRASGLDWTIARPGNLIEGPHTGTYRHGFVAGDEAPSLKISFADVADFLIRQIKRDDYLHRAPALSY